MRPARAAAPGWNDKKKGARKEMEQGNGRADMHYATAAQRRGLMDVCKRLLDRWIHASVQFPARLRLQHKIQYSFREVGEAEQFLEGLGSVVTEEEEGNETRHWLVIKEDGRTVTGRQEPRLVLISVSCEGGFLTLNAPDMKELNIPLKLPRTNPVWNCRILGHEIQGRDCGEETASWINAFLKGSEPYRLAQFEHHMKPRNSMEEFALYRRNDQNVYSDIAPIMLLSEASMDDLNTRLDKKVKMRNFRPGIAVSGCSAYEEDSWDEIVIGSAELTRVMPCPRKERRQEHTQKRVERSRKERGTSKKAKAKKDAFSPR